MTRLRFSLVEAGELVIRGLQCRHGVWLEGGAVVLRLVYLEGDPMPQIWVEFEPQLAPASTSEAN